MRTRNQITDLLNISTTKYPRLKFDIQIERQPYRYTGYLLCTVITVLLIFLFIVLYLDYGKLFILGDSHFRLVKNYRLGEIYRLGTVHTWEGSVVSLALLADRKILFQPATDACEAASGSGRAETPSCSSPVTQSNENVAPSSRLSSMAAWPSSSPGRSCPF